MAFTQATRDIRHWHDEDPAPVEVYVCPVCGEAVMQGAWTWDHVKHPDAGWSHTGRCAELYDVTVKELAEIAAAAEAYAEYRHRLATGTLIESDDQYLNAELDGVHYLDYLGTSRSQTSDQHHTDLHRERGTAL